MTDEMRLRRILAATDLDDSDDVEIRQLLIVALNDVAGGFEDLSDEADEEPGIRRRPRPGQRRVERRVGRMIWRPQAVRRIAPDRLCVLGCRGREPRKL
jgi:hypothetical protein